MLGRQNGAPIIRLSNADQTWPQLGRDVIETFDLMIRRQNAFRAQHGADAIHDISYIEQVSDPIGTIRKVYDHFGDEFTPEAEQQMHHYLEAKPKGRYGKHVYNIADYGMTDDWVRDHFADYISDFDIPTNA